jgi:MFS family permease
MAALCAAQVLDVLGVTVVIVALPAIGADFRLGTSSLQLVVTVYAVVYGGLLLTTGRIADLVDRRAVFAGGLGVMLAGSVGYALAPSDGVLLAARAAQGLGGAFVSPAALSLLTASFPAGRGRRIALSAWTGAAAGGGAAGFVVAGLLVDVRGWRGVFWLLVPLAAMVLVSVRWLVPAHPPTPERRGVDVPGSLTATAGLAVLLWGSGLVGPSRNTPLLPIIVLLVGLGLLGVFVVLQRHGRSPLIAWSELTNSSFMTANGAAFVNTATTSAASTLVALIAQHVLTSTRARPGSCFYRSRSWSSSAPPAARGGFGAGRTSGWRPA